VSDNYPARKLANETVNKQIIMISVFFEDAPGAIGMKGRRQIIQSNK